ncbi:DUF5993 family protein [Poriferisphaera corsica]|uniref:DUF5993 family protein n=1 Tax=Poriferisphaera corsica TaxID=2528020 RepID=UPI00190B9F60|nr:DUF5993 family protein [Poriferisphaera corsica]
MMLLLYILTLLTFFLACRGHYRSTIILFFISLLYASLIFAYHASSPLDIQL